MTLFLNIISLPISTLRARITALTLALLAPTAILLFVAIRNLDAQRRQRLDSDTESTYNLALRQMQSLFNDITMSATVLAQSSQIVSRDALGASQLLRNLYLQKDEVQVVFASDGHGHIFASSHSLNTANESAVATAPYFHAVFERSGVVISGAVPDPITNQLVIIVAAPTKDSVGHPVGAVMIGISLYRLYDLMERFVERPGDALVIRDADNRSVISVGTKQMNRNEFVVQQSMREENDKVLLRYHDTSHGQYMVTLAGPVYGTPFRMTFSRSGLPGDFIFANRTVVLIVWYMLIGTFVVLSVAYGVGTWMSRPLTALIDAINRVITRNEWNKIDATTGYGELKLVVGAFNDLVETVRARDREISAQRDQLHKYSTQLKKLLSEVMHAQEEERRRISGDLHDGVTQQVIGVHYHVQSALGFLQQGDLVAVQEALRQATAELRAVTDEVHRVVYTLRPRLLDQRGLSPALTDLARSYQTMPPRIHVSVLVEGEPCELPWEQEIALYRVAQECLNNAWKYAPGASVTVTLRYEVSWVELTVSDTGAGFEVGRGGDRPSVHLGLQGMRERIEMVQGQLVVESRPGQGTRITARIPRFAAV